jgi:uncharacterized protein YlxW (UPF0749 family)
VDAEHRDTGTGWPPPSAARPAPPADGTPIDTGPDTDTDSARTAGRRRATRLSVAGASIGLLLVVLGFAFVVQVRSNAGDPQLAAARPEDLVRILSDLNAREERLRQEITALEESRRQLASGAQGREAALAEARRRAEVLGILAGTLPAEGPGLEITMTEGAEGVKAETILDTVEELRGAGAEAMQIAGGDGTGARIVASTYFVDADGGINVEGHQLTAPYTIAVIGDPQTMQTALNIPGGVVDTVRQRGGNVAVRKPDTVRVTVLHPGNPLRFARPS